MGNHLFDYIHEADCAQFSDTYREVLANFGQGLRPQGGELVSGPYSIICKFLEKPAARSEILSFKVRTQVRSLHIWRDDTHAMSDRMNCDLRRLNSLFDCVRLIASVRLMNCNPFAPTAHALHRNAERAHAPQPVTHEVDTVRATA